MAVIINLINVKITHYLTRLQHNFFELIFNGVKFIISYTTVEEDLLSFHYKLKEWKSLKMRFCILTLLSVPM